MHTDNPAGPGEGPLRDRYAAAALAYVPHLVQLVDRNPYSPTYGCFDREYWHYRTLDFPCGMSQEMVLPFALLYTRDFPGSPYRGRPRLREIAEAGIRFAARAAHADGTCDDYFPYERAMGALVFSLYACTEAYQLLDLRDGALVDFFRRRADHLIRVNETGRLSNHQALAALAAYNVYRLTGDDRYRRLSDDRVALTLAWQHPEEGWFQEYEGADPGYQTCTLSFLAKLHRKRGDDALVGPLTRAVGFAWHFMHPDGSYGGEYGSRNTYHFYPHGFEVMAPHTEQAGQVADQFLRGLACGKRYHNDDDRMCGHCVHDWLQAWLDYHPNRPPPLNARPDFVRWFPAARLLVAKTPRAYTVAGLAKGGVYKCFDEDGPLASDTGLIGELEDGRVLVSHLVDPDRRIEADPAAGRFAVEGVFHVRRAQLSSPLKLVVFRLLLLTVGRFAPNLLRRLVQRLLITYKTRTSYRFRRTFRIGPAGLEVTDTLPAPVPFRRLSQGSDATSIYVANSNTYQESVLRCPWRHADAATLQAARAGRLAWTRRVPEAPA